MRRVLRSAIVLLGLQLSLAQVVEVGTAGLAIIVLTLAATFLFTMWLVCSRCGLAVGSQSTASLPS